MLLSFCARLPAALPLACMQRRCTRESGLMTAGMAAAFVPARPAAVLLRSAAGRSCTCLHAATRHWDIGFDARRNGRELGFLMFSRHDGLCICGRARSALFRKGHTQKGHTQCTLLCDFPAQTQRAGPASRDAVSPLQHTLTAVCRGGKQLLRHRGGTRDALLSLIHI